MSLESHVDDYPSCANIRHAILNAQVVYCPHDRTYTLSCYLGDDSGSMWSDRRFHYGPFDDVRDVAADLAKWLNVIGRRVLLEASLGYHEQLWEPQQSPDAT